MIVFPNAKINIGLNVVSKRSDGYHNLETIFYPVKICDALEMIPSDKTELTASGIQIDGHSEDNLILKAYRLLQADFNIPPVKFHLHKIIPFGAGLGGGSSDAAFTLRMLNKFFKLGLAVERLENYASKIGADCPFFIQNKPTFATGIGDQFQPVEIDLTGFEIVILKPDFSVSTPAAFKGVTPGKPNSDLIETITQPIENWEGFVINDFEKSVFPQFPEIENLKKLLYNLGASYASISGSGSAVFGIFRRLPALFENKIPEGIFIYR